MLGQRYLDRYQDCSDNVTIQQPDCSRCSWSIFLGVVLQLPGKALQLVQNWECVPCPRYERPLSPSTGELTSSLAQVLDLPEGLLHSLHTLRVAILKILKEGSRV